MLSVTNIKVITFRRDSTPEVVRIRFKSDSPNAHSNVECNAPEVIRHPPGIQPQVLLQNHSETAAGVELAIPKSDAEIQGIRGMPNCGSGAEIIRVKSSVHQGRVNIQG